VQKHGVFVERKHQVLSPPLDVKDGPAADTTSKARG
jgi:hypothetical protein